MAIRMKDIAKDLGVSAITVSKALRDHPDISQETKERIRRRVKELNYQPNFAARALVTGRTFSIGFIVPDLIHPFFGEVAKGLADTLRDRDYNVVIASSEESPAVEDRSIELMLARRVDALVVASAHRDGRSFESVAERNVPYVLIDRHFGARKSNFVGVDDEAVGTLAAGHLIAAGCRRIAHIRGPRVSTAIGRAKGYRKALVDHGMEPRTDYVVVEETGDASGDVSGYRAMTHLLSIKPRPDGVFCYNDPTAMGAMQAIFDAGLTVPHDIAVVGCGNVRYAQFLRVPLTSVDQNSEQIGARAGLLGLQLIEARTQPKPVSILLEPTLVPRESTRRTGHAS